MGIPEREWWKHREFVVHETIAEQFPNGRTQVSILKGFIKDVSRITMKENVSTKRYITVKLSTGTKKKRKRKKAGGEKKRENIKYQELERIRMTLDFSTVQEARR